MGSKCCACVVLGLAACSVRVYVRKGGASHADLSESQEHIYNQACKVESSYMRCVRMYMDVCMDICTQNTHVYLKKNSNTIALIPQADRICPTCFAIE